MDPEPICGIAEDGGFVGAVDLAGDLLASAAGAVGIASWNGLAHFDSILSWGEAVTNGGEQRTIVARGHDGRSAIGEGGAAKKGEFDSILPIALIGEEDQHHSAVRHLLAEFVRAGSAVEEHQTESPAKSAQEVVEGGGAQAAVSRCLAVLRKITGHAGEQFETAEMTGGQQDVAGAESLRSGARTRFAHLNQTLGRVVVHRRELERRTNILANPPEVLASDGGDFMAAFGVAKTEGEILARDAPMPRVQEINNAAARTPELSGPTQRHQAKSADGQPQNQAEQFPAHGQAAGPEGWGGTCG